MSAYLDYSTAGQTPNTPLAVSSPRDPTTSDVIASDGAPYNVGRDWINTTSKAIFTYAGGGTWTANIALVGPYTPTTFTSHGVIIGEGAAALQATAAGTNGQVLLGSTGANPAFGTLTSADGSVTFTTGAGSLALSVASSSIAKTTTVLTSAQVKALNATPITIVPAQAAGKTILLLGAQAKLTYGGTNVFTLVGAGDISLYDASPAGSIIATLTASGFMDASANTYQVSAVIPSPITLATGLEAQPIVASIPSGSIAGNAAGDNTLTITVVYVVLTQ